MDFVTAHVHVLIEDALNNDSGQQSHFTNAIINGSVSHGLKQLSTQETISQVPKEQTIGLVHQQMAETDRIISAACTKQRTKEVVPDEEGILHLCELAGIEGNLLPDCKHLCTFMPWHNGTSHYTHTAPDATGNSRFGSIKPGTILSPPTDFQTPPPTHDEAQLLWIQVEHLDKETFEEKRYVWVIASTAHNAYVRQAQQADFDRQKREEATLASKASKEAQAETIRLEHDHDLTKLVDDPEESYENSPYPNGHYAGFKKKTCGRT